MVYPKGSRWRGLREDELDLLYKCVTEFGINAPATQEGMETFKKCADLQVEIVRALTKLDIKYDKARNL